MPHIPVHDSWIHGIGRLDSRTRTSYAASVGRYFRGLHRSRILTIHEVQAEIPLTVSEFKSLTCSYFGDEAAVLNSYTSSTMPLSLLPS